MKARKRRFSPKLESLEQKTPLAADACCNLETFDAGQVTALDAGSTFSSAYQLGDVSGATTLPGRVGGIDARDMIQFSTSQTGLLALRLDGMSFDIDLALYNANGSLIASSRNAGVRRESIRIAANEGDVFYAAITPWSRFSSTAYQFSLTLRTPAGVITTPPSEPTPPTTSPTNPTPTTPTNPTPAPTQPTTPSNPPPTITQPPQPPVNQPPTSQPVSAFPEVAYFGSGNDWNLNSINVPEVWSQGYTGEGVTVAVVDSGVDLDHADLVSNLWVNPGEIPGNGIDDDRNGYVDDIHGYDFAANDSRPDDVNGHGTHVAGTIAAARNNQGATGVAYNAEIMAVRVLGNNGSGSNSDVAAGIRYAAANGADIINLSLGGGYSTSILSAIQYANNLGSIVIAAAGNESANVPGYPARFSSSNSNVISVGAYSSSDRIASFSNDVGNSGAIQVDAPGQSVYSTYVGGRYGRLNGTSMAAPHVAGLAALTLSANPDLTSSELRSLIVDGANRSIAGSDALGGINAAYTVALAAAGQTGSAISTSSASANSALANYFARTRRTSVELTDIIFQEARRSTLDSAIERSDTNSANEVSTTNVNSNADTYREEFSTQRFAMPTTQFQFVGNADSERDSFELKPLEDAIDGVFGDVP